MTRWHERTIEQRNLLNPAFCALILWELASGFQEEAKQYDEERALPLEFTFVGASFVLRGQTRARLPASIRTSLATWINDNPLERSAVAKGVVILRPYIHDALIFGAQHDLFHVTGRFVLPKQSHAKKITNYINTNSPEVKACMQQAKFTGRWLYKNGSLPTVLAQLGVQP